MFYPAVIIGTPFFLMFSCFLTILTLYPGMLKTGKTVPPGVVGLGVGVWSGPDSLTPPPPYNPPHPHQKRGVSRSKKGQKSLDRHQKAFHNGEMLIFDHF